MRFSEWRLTTLLARTNDAKATFPTQEQAAELLIPISPGVFGLISRWNCERCCHIFGDMTRIGITRQQQKESLAHEVGRLAIACACAVGNEFGKLVRHSRADFFGELANVCCASHSAPRRKNPTGHEWPMGKVHAFDQGGESKVWPWIGCDHLDRLSWLLAGLGGSDPRQRTVHAIRDGLRENFRPHIDGVAGFVSHGLCGFDGRSPKHFDCFLFIHAAL